MKYKIDAYTLKGGKLVIDGWGFKASGEPLDIRVELPDGGTWPFEAAQRDRRDIVDAYGAQLMTGFTVELPFERDMEAVLILSGDGRTVRKPLSSSVVEESNSIRSRQLKKLRSMLDREHLENGISFLRENGIRAFGKKLFSVLRHADADFDYGEWEKAVRPSEEELAAQRGDWRKLEAQPLISIVVPAYNTEPAHLKILLESFAAQTYPRFEAVIADGSDPGKDGVGKVCRAYAAQDARIVYHRLEQNLGIAGNTNAGLGLAKGDFIALCDHDDVLPPWALYEVAKAVNAHPEARFIYTDEDKIDADGRAFFDPHFKPDFNMELLCSVNYICHLSVVRRDLLEKVSGFRQEFDGAQDYDFFFRCLEEAVSGEDPAVSAPDRLKAGLFTSERVIHIPRVCYHWRYHQGSTAQDPRAKLYAFEAGARALKAHYERCGIPYKDVVQGVTYGYYRTTFEKPGPDAPLISVIIPNKDHVKDLDTCIRSILKNSEYTNLEFVIIENNSTEEETFEYYKAIEHHPSYFVPEKADAELPDIRVVRFEKAFNYSAINNFGVSCAKGPLLLLLNNDTELIDPASLTEMAANLQRPGVGAVGARLMYDDDTVQHGGCIIGMGGIAGAAFVGYYEKENSYMHRMMSTQALSAVTAACLMTRKESFLMAGGMNEELAVAFNDMDYCMRIRSLGQKVIYAPYASFHHYESKSRGLEDTPEKIRRFNGEIAVFAHEWKEILEQGDPYYNPNLTLRKANFALRDLRVEKPGEPYRLELDVERQLREVLAERERRERKSAETQGGHI